jgi:hypothetical protein
MCNHSLAVDPSGINQAEYLGSMKEYRKEAISMEAESKRSGGQLTGHLLRPIPNLVFSGRKYRKLTRSTQ